MRAQRQAMAMEVEMEMSRGSRGKWSYSERVDTCDICRGTTGPSFDISPYHTIKGGLFSYSALVYSSSPDMYVQMLS